MFWGAGSYDPLQSHYVGQLGGKEGAARETTTGPLLPKQPAPHTACPVKKQSLQEGIWFKECLFGTYT